MSQEVKPPPPPPSTTTTITQSSPPPPLPSSSLLAAYKKGAHFSTTEEDDDDGAGIDADADDDDDEHYNTSSWKKLGMSKLFGKKKKSMRRKKYTKTVNAAAAAASSNGGDYGVGGVGVPLALPGAAAGGGEEMDSSAMDSSINTQTEVAAKRRPPRQRAKVAMYPAKNLLDNSNSEYDTERGLEPLDAQMQAALPQRRWHHNNQRSTRPVVAPPDPPTSATSNNSTTAPSITTLSHHTAHYPRHHHHHQHHSRRKKKDCGGDGYENSGHETSDFIFTEDENMSDFMGDAGTADQRTVMDFLDVYCAQKISLGSDDDDEDDGDGDGDGDKKSSNGGNDGGDKKSSSYKKNLLLLLQHDDNNKATTSIPSLSEDKATPQSSAALPARVLHSPAQPPLSLQHQTTKTSTTSTTATTTSSPSPSTPITSPTKPKKKRTPRSRRTKPKNKAIVPRQPQTVPEDPPTLPPPFSSSGMMQQQEEEELNNCGTPMKMSLQQRQQQTTKKSRQQQQQQQQQKATNQQVQQQQQNVIDEKDHDIDPHEDEDDYPSSMTPAKKKEEEGGDGKDDKFTSSSNTSNDNNNNNSPTGKSIEDELTFLKMHHHQPKKRTLEEEMSFLKRISSTRYQVQLGFVPNMKVPAEIIVNNDLQTLLVQELKDSCCSLTSESSASFIPALRQAANVAALPGIVRASLAMPDVHSGYGFCIGNVAAFDMDDPSAVISPGGVGFDINCGVRLIRTNLTEEDVGEESVREALAEAMFRNIPVGVGAGGDIPCNLQELDKLLAEGVNWAIEKGYAWEEDREHCEEDGRMETADPKCVSNRAKKRGLKQLGTLGAGNHYAEIQVVDEIYHPEAASTMGIGKLGQVCIMIHTGSRGLGHQVATDALTVMERAMARDKIDLNDRQLSCARISSKEGKEYLAAMSSAANFAWVNRSCITYLTRKAFSEVFDREPEEMDMHLVYDVCHNIAKVEKHMVDGVEKTLLVHRKGSTRAFPPQHPNIPKDYQSIGQPVLIGGTMGTCSYVLVGTEKGMTETFGSTCHGAGRALSRNQSRKRLDHDRVLDQLHKSGISIRVASPKLVTEEAPESYKNVCDVIETCQDAGISKKVVKLRPIAVIKG